MAKIRIEYFAILRDHVGRPGEEIDTSSRTVADLFDELDQQYRFPKMSQLKVAINDEFGDWDSELTDGDSVVFIPPVAGG